MCVCVSVCLCVCVSCVSVCVHTTPHTHRHPYHRRPGAHNGQGGARRLDGPSKLVYRKHLYRGRRHHATARTKPRAKPRTWPRRRARRSAKDSACKACRDKTPVRFTHSCSGGKRTRTRQGHNNFCFFCFFVNDNLLCTAYTAVLGGSGHELPRSKVQVIIISYVDDNFLCK